ncbi:hypothetical protein [Marinivivus vitaminiproducens]|uniref:hypothetical protein n=1 Tax=Marinivivus vitaminiproducens TaxID=3035935 RepID=UPI00279C613D|nr:hypothetical protein P4R82_25000 [Geminicoccaceae bacterium SCSIO 64248]
MVSANLRWSRIELWCRSDHDWASAQIRAVATDARYFEHHAEADEVLDAVLESLVGHAECGGEGGWVAGANGRVVEIRETNPIDAVVVTAELGVWS